MNDAEISYIILMGRFLIYLISTYFQMILYRHPEEEVQRSRIQFGKTEKNGDGDFAWSQCKNDEATH